MSGLKEIRNRISSVSSTMQITNAMKMVSAAKLKKAQDSISATLPYSNKLSELIKSISSSLDSDESNSLFEKRIEKNILIVAITSNKGLCGGFNSNIIKEVNNFKKENESKNIDILAIGKKGNDILKKTNCVISSHNEVYDNFNYSSIKTIAENIMTKFSEKEYDQVILIYNHFKNAATQIVIKEQFLPISEDNENENDFQGDYIFDSFSFLKLLTS
ncbi:MAG: F0F1 ATP synthase subunit gamma, partial [Candidatus Marinimicrobia bacterium]|nr:F0F1 ATP synthase subunit gamma [Candidatus Neomarinimicrobiota bacterium]